MGDETRAAAVPAAEMPMAWAVKLSTGTVILDSLLDGGLEYDVISTVYGPAGSGKSCFCMLCCITVARAGKKVLYVDTEGGFSVERFKQLAPDDYEKLMQNIVFFKPVSFEEQKKAFVKLKNTISSGESGESRLGLIVVDTISMLYRLAIGEAKQIPDVNREMGLQISYLAEIARKKKVPVLLTNQVYADFEDRNRVNLVGGDILKYGSKCLIELKKLHKGRRVAIVRKHRSIPEEKEAMFDLVQNGIAEVEEKAASNVGEM